MTQLQEIKQEGFQGFEIGDKHLGAVVVIQEAVGVIPILKKTAMDIHKKTGLRVLIPDLFDGQIFDSVGDAIKYISDDTSNKMVTFGKKIDAAIHYLRNSGSKKVGCVGFCLGGFLAYYASQHSQVECATAFYGTPAQYGSLVEVEKMKKNPFQAFFGKLDQFKGNSDYETAVSYEKKMNEAGINNQYYYIEDAGHSYLNATYDEGKAFLKSANFPIPSQASLDKTWDLMTSFQKTHLM